MAGKKKGGATKPKPADTKKDTKKGGKKGGKKKTTKNIERPLKVLETLVAVVLDSSGSMCTCLSDTIQGHNAYLKSLRQQTGKFKYSLTKFGSHVQTPTEFASLEDAVNLTSKNYVPGGLTALYDGIGSAIENVDEYLKNKRRKRSVLMVILTDGEENHSREYSQSKIKSLIKEREKQGWTFVYLGANQDVWSVGNQLGLKKGNVLSYSTENMTKTFDQLSVATRRYGDSTHAKVGLSVDNFFRG